MSIPDKALSQMEPEAAQMYRDSAQGEGDQETALVSMAISLRRIADGMRHLDIPRMGTRWGIKG